MNTSTEHILQCNQSEPLADPSGKIVDLMKENDTWMYLQRGCHTVQRTGVYHRMENITLNIGHIRFKDGGT